MSLNSDAISFDAALSKLKKGVINTVELTLEANMKRKFNLQISSSPYKVCDGYHHNFRCTLSEKQTALVVSELIKLEKLQTFVLKIDSSSTCPQLNHKYCDIFRQCLHVKSERMRFNLDRAENSCVSHIFTRPSSSLSSSSSSFSSSSSSLVHCDAFEFSKSSYPLHEFFKNYLAVGNVKNFLWSGNVALMDAFSDALDQSTCAVEEIYIFPATQQSFDAMSNKLFSAKFPSCLKKFRLCTQTPFRSGDSLHVNLEPLLDTFLQRNVMLTTMDLRNYALKQNSFDKLAEYVSHPNCQLTVLELKECNFTSVCIDFSKFASSFAHNTTIKKLSMKRFDQVLNVQWIESLATNTVLQDLEITEVRGVQFISYDVLAFAKIVSRNYGLTRLCVLNAISFRQFEELNKVIDKNYSLQTIEHHFHNVGVGDSVKHTLARNRLIVWNKVVFDLIVNCCIALASLDMPPYCLLWIMDWLPLSNSLLWMTDWLPVTKFDFWSDKVLMHLVNHRKKIGLIERIVGSIRCVNARRLESL